MKISRPDLIWKDGYEEPLTREKAYPYVVATSIAILIILLSVKTVY